MGLSMPVYCFIVSTNLPTYLPTYPSICQRPWHGALHLLSFNTLTNHDSVAQTKHITVLKSDTDPGRTYILTSCEPPSVQRHLAPRGSPCHTRAEFTQELAGVRRICRHRPLWLQIETEAGRFECRL